MKLSDAVKIYAGSQEVAKVYAGSVEVWSAEAPVETGDETFYPTSDANDGSYDSVREGFDAVGGGMGIYIGDAQGGGNSHYSWFFNFPAVSIPQGAKIIAATFTLTGKGGDATTINLDVFGNAADNAENPTNGAGFLALALTTAKVRWAGVGAFVDGTAYSPNDISPVVQEIVNRPGWESGNSLMLVLQDNICSNNAWRSIFSYHDGVPTKYPALHIEWTTANHVGSFYPATGTDDGNTDLVGGSFYANALFPYMGDAGGGGSSHWSWFFNFGGVLIPPGATITSATLSLTGTGGSDNNVNMDIYANDADSAVSPTSHAEFDALSLTTEKGAWNAIEAFSSGVEYTSPDLTDVIQEVVDRAGWDSGHALMLILKDNASSNGAWRGIRSRDEATSSLQCPRLDIEWTE